MTVATLFIATLLLQAVPGGGRVRVQVTSATTGARIPGASVELPDLERRVLTGVSGEAMLLDVPPGPHHLRVRSVGFEPRQLHVFVGERRELLLTVVLTPVPTRLAGLRVESPPLIELPGASPGVSPLQRVVRDRELRQHPLVPEPDLLLGLAGGHVAARAEAPAGLSVMGGPPDHVAYRVDGIPMRSPYHGGGTFAAVSPDAIAESVVDATTGTLPVDNTLGGGVRWTPRPAATALHWMGGVSSTQSRLLIEAGNGQVAVMAAGRVLFPGLAWQKSEAAHLVGEGSDGIVRAIVPVAGGTLRGIAFASLTSSSFASRVPEDPGAANAPRHEFNWRSSAAGLRWERTVGSTALGLTAWHNRVGATAEWYPDSGGGPSSFLDSDLRDRGVEASVVRSVGAGVWSLAAQMRRLSSDYRVMQHDEAGSLLQYAQGRWVPSLQPQWKYVANRMSLGVGSVWWGSRYVAPFAELGWRPSARWRASLGVARRYQHTQSMRNGESIGGLVFGAETPAVAHAHGVPVARSDQALAAADWSPTASHLVTWRAWTRRFRGLALPAVGNAYPFAVRLPATGSGRATGGSLEVSHTATRWGVLGSYAVQRVSLTAADTTWQPEFAVRQTFDVGAIVHLTPQFSFRIGGSGGAGRRVTGFTGSFEWESCNLRDRGCEFAGAPGRTPGALGAVALPAWVRWDATGRAHGHLHLAGRDVQFDVFASWSNLLDRRNVLTRIRDKSSGAPQDVVMRPSSPLVVGVDWRM